MQFAAIKRSLDNDNHPGKEESYNIKIFASKNDAVEWLLQNYEHWDDEHCTGDDREWDNTVPGWHALHEFFLNSKNGDTMFHWEWERRGNFRTYRIVEFDPNEGIQFYAKGEVLFSFYEEKIMNKSEVDKLKEDY